MSREFRDFVLKGGLVDLEEKLIRGGSGATRARFGAAREANSALPKRRQNSNMQRRLKRAETYLGKRGKRGGRKVSKGKYDPRTQRPRTLAQMRTFADHRLVAARSAHATMLLHPDGGRGRVFNQRRADRLERIHRMTSSALNAWEARKRPPSGFRRGK